MVTRELAFSTFLKLLELTDAQKRATLRGFKRGGGYNYWRPLQLLAAEAISGKLGLSDVQDKVAFMAKGHQRKYNERALTSILKWASRRRLQLRDRPERVVKKFGNSGLKVRLEPEVAFLMDRRRYLMHIWATNSPTLSEETLSMGLFFFRHHMQGTVEPDCQFLIFDAVKDRIFAEFNILSNAGDMLTRQRESLNKHWSDLESEGETSGPAPEKDDGSIDDSHPPA